MCLIGEADCRRGIGERLAGQNHCAGAPHPHMAQVRVWRQSISSLELAENLESREPGDLGEFVEGHQLLVASLDGLACSGQSWRVPPIRIARVEAGMLPECRPDSLEK